jgi:hypothetical protein
MGAYFGLASEIGYYFFRPDRLGAMGGGITVDFGTLVDAFLTCVGFLLTCVVSVGFVDSVMIGLSSSVTSLASSGYEVVFSAGNGVTVSGSYVLSTGGAGSAIDSARDRRNVLMSSFDCIFCS